ncbi:hypothetical protein EU523_00920 [Candidatus Heimdallarchaeota archaeon]|jgi:hypothetical protein|nr:MAG: hypothetical protein EU523_00920 [Candidatus Heimdallarchaeota archaeon]
MIAVTKEIEEMLRNLFEARNTTEIPAAEILETLNISLNSFEEMLKENEELSSEFKLLRAPDGEQFVKRLFLKTAEGPDDLTSFQIEWETKIEWDNLDGCPCFTCHELERCDIGNPLSSVDCPLFTRWLFKDPKDNTK